MRAVIFFALTACGAATELDGKDAAPDVVATTIEAGPPPFCESLTLKPLFCDDFDDGTLAKWTSTSDRNGGAITITSDVARSPPFAMSARTPNALAIATLVKSFPDLTGSRHVMLSFSLLASAECFAEDTQVANLVVANMAFAQSVPLFNPLSASLAVAGTVSALALFQPGRLGGVPRKPITFPIAPIPEDHTWQRVAIDIDLRSDAPRATVVTPTRTTTIPMYVMPNELDSPTLTLGAAGVSPCTVLFDDVIFDAR